MSGFFLVAPCLLLSLILKLTNPTRRIDFRSQGSPCLCSPGVGIYKHVSPYPAFTWVQGIQTQALMLVQWTLCTEHPLPSPVCYAFSTR